MNEIVNAVGEEVQITNDFLSLLVAVVVVVVRTFFVRVFKYFFKNQKCENSTCKYIIYNVFAKELLLCVSLLLQNTNVILAVCCVVGATNLESKAPSLSSPCEYSSQTWTGLRRTQGTDGGRHRPGDLQQQN